MNEMNGTRREKNYLFYEAGVLRYTLTTVRKDQKLERNYVVLR